MEVAVLNSTIVEHEMSVRVAMANRKLSVLAVVALLQALFSAQASIPHHDMSSFPITHHVRRVTMTLVFGDVFGNTVVEPPCVISRCDMFLTNRGVRYE